MLQYYGLNTIFFRIPHTMKFRTALSKAWTMQVETHTVEFFCFGGDLGGIWSVFITKSGQNMLMQSSWEGKNGTFLDTVCLKTSLSAVFWSITMNLNFVCNCLWRGDNYIWLDLVTKEFSLTLYWHWPFQLPETYAISAHWIFIYKE